MCLSINTSNNTKRIVPYKNYENTIFRKMKGFQVREDSPKQIVVPTRTIKILQNNNNKWPIANGPLQKLCKMHYWGECHDV
jgi:hypothetical protein